MNEELLDQVNSENEDYATYDDPSKQSALEYVLSKETKFTSSFQIRPQRRRRLPERYGLLARAEVDNSIPTVKKALKSADAENWLTAIHTELRTLKKNTPELVEHPKNEKVSRSKIVLKL